MTEFSWEFGDGVSLNSGTVPMTSHTYATAGTYTVRGKVKDSSGHTAEATVTITVT
jgi:PKD repeat protein